MKMDRVTGFCLLALVAGTLGDGALGQDLTFRVIDFVDLPAGLWDNAMEQQAENCCDVEFHETWQILPGKPVLHKRVVAYSLRDGAQGTVTSDSLPDGLVTLVNHLPLVKGSRQLRNVTYEFMFLDPHLPDAPAYPAPEPGTLDSLSRALQLALIKLIPEGLPSRNLYDLEEQMLSVRFHETWNIDPATLEIGKVVEAITPVIWQRRQSEMGEPVNDAETGLPVYYKVPLNRIGLRNL